MNSMRYTRFFLRIDTLSIIYLVVVIITMFNDLMTEMKGFLMAPTETFKKTNGKSLGTAYQYYVALLVIFTVLYGIVVVSMGLAMFISMVDKMGPSLSSEALQRALLQISPASSLPLGDSLSISCSSFAC